MQADKFDYGTEWKFLQSRGWTIAPSDMFPRGTAVCYAKEKKILMRPSVFAAPNRRVRKYVVPHEIWHAVHFEVLNYGCDELLTARKLKPSAGLEVVADGACLYKYPSSLMRAWVRASVIWHGKVGYKYSMKDLVCPENIAIIRCLVSAVNEWRGQQAKQQAETGSGPTS